MMHRDSTAAGGDDPREVPAGNGQADHDCLPTRLPPHNIEVEQQLISALVSAPEVLPGVRAIVRGPGDFYRAFHQEIYRALCDLADRGVAIDGAILWEELLRLGHLSRGERDLARLGAILTSAPHACNAAYHGGIVREKALGRDLIDLAASILEEAYGQGETVETLIGQAAERLASLAEAAAGATSSIIWAEDIEERAIEWLWPGRVPLRKLCTLAGPGGVGKSFLLCDIAARVSTGAEWPHSEGARAPVGNTLYISGEDDADDTLRPRLRLQGADLTKVAFLTAGTLASFTMACRAQLDRALKDMGGQVSLVIFDPPSAFLDAVDENSNARVRGALRPLKEWAHAHDCAMIFNAHVNKAVGKNLDAQARVLGSVAWVNAPRVAHLVTWDPEDPEEVLFLPLKTNIGRRPKALSFRVVEDSLEHEFPRLVWTGERDVSAKEALGCEAQAPVTKKEKIERWLLCRFRERPVWRTADLDDALRADLGYVIDSMFDNVRRALGIKTRKVGKGWETYVDDDWIYSRLPE